MCQAYANGDHGVMLYVKPGLPLRALLVEALAAQVGQCMGIPCPTPYIVTANPIHIGRAHGPKLLAFGSEQVGNRALTRSVLDTEVMLELLDKQRLTEQICCFDELIANSVRSPRDILFDPEHGAVIVDHEDAMQASVKADDAVTNWLADRVLERTPADQRAQLLKKLRARSEAVHRMQLDVVPATVQFDQQGVPAYSELLEFLRQRLTHLDQLLSSRVLPAQGYLIAPNEDHAAGGTTDV